MPSISGRGKGVAQAGIRKDVFAAMNRAALDRQPGQIHRVGWGLRVNGCGHCSCALRKRAGPHRGHILRDLQLPRGDPVRARQGVSAEGRAHGGGVGRPGAQRVEGCPRGGHPLRPRRDARGGLHALRLRLPRLSAGLQALDHRPAEMVAPGAQEDHAGGAQATTLPISGRCTSI